VGKQVWLLIKQVWLLISGLAILFTLAGGYAFKSKIDISSGTLLDRTNPYSTPFILTNSGLFPLYNIEWAVELLDVDYGVPNSFAYKITFSSSQRISSFDAGQKTTNFISAEVLEVRINGKPPPIRKMEVICSVSYQNVIRQQEKQSFRFLCMLDKDGNYEWLPYAYPFGAENQTPGALLRYQTPNGQVTCARERLFLTQCVSKSSKARNFRR
jgi:hypothetical protein